MSKLPAIALIELGSVAGGAFTTDKMVKRASVKLMQADKWDQQLLTELSTAMIDASICGLGQAAPNPILLTMKHFADEV